MSLPPKKNVLKRYTRPVPSVSSKPQLSPRFFLWQVSILNIGRHMQQDNKHCYFPQARTCLEEGPIFGTGSTVPNVEVDESKTAVEAEAVWEHYVIIPIGLVAAAGLTALVSFKSNQATDIIISMMKACSNCVVMADTAGHLHRSHRLLWPTQ